MLDTKGPEIRSGFFANGASKITLVKGETSECVAAYGFLLDCWLYCWLGCDDVVAPYLAL